MRKFQLVLILAMLMSALNVSFAGATTVGGVEIIENEASNTGYTVNFSYHDAEATNVRLTGTFKFYVKDDIRIFSRGWYTKDMAGYSDRESYLVDPEQWDKDSNLRHMEDHLTKQPYTVDMVRDEATGMWTCSLDLPCAAYLYNYMVSYDNGENYERIADPSNIPAINDLGSEQARSTFNVPFNADKQSAYDDWTWLFPMDNQEYRGTVISRSYKGAYADETPLLIYLPANYDAEREEPYKVLYLSHGGGGEEGDWFHQGNAANVIDHLVADGQCEAFIIVCMNNSDIQWDYQKIYEDFKDCMIPYMEENFNVSKEASGRAYAGLSAGGMTASELYYRDPLLCGYYGFFSCAEAYDMPVLDDYTNHKAPNIYMAVGFADRMLSSQDPDYAASYGAELDHTIQGMADKLNAAQIEFNGGKGFVVVDSAHDWFGWPMILRDYAATTLWK